MINVFTPNAEHLAKGVALNLAFRFGMSTAEPFKASEYVGKEKNPELLDLGELEGRTWLTSLALKHGGKEFVFNECLISLNMEKKHRYHSITALDLTLGVFKQILKLH